MHTWLTPARTVALAALTVTTLLSSSALACCRNAAEFATMCQRQGMSVQYNPPRCVPLSGSSISRGGGGSPNQQLMMGLAGLLGDALADSLNNQEAARQQDRQREMEEAAAAMLRFEQEEKLRMEKHRQLLSNLKGSLGGTELGMKGLGTQPLELKGGTDFFGTSLPSGTITEGKESIGLSLKMLDESAIPVPQAKPVDAATMDKVWQDYYQAAEQMAGIELRRRQLEVEQGMVKQIRQEAEKKYQEQQARVAVIPKEQPNRKEEDDKLAEAERLLQQATNLDNQAARDLEQTKRDAEKAKADMDRAEHERNTQEKSLAQAGKEPGK
jgi:hypothetical protein